MDSEDFYLKLKKFTELDWSNPDTHQRSQKNLRRLKWLKGVGISNDGDIGFQELEKCLSKMMKHWSFYWDHFMVVNRGDNTFDFVTSIVDDVFVDSYRVVGIVQASTMYDLYGKVILLAYAGIKSVLIVTREEKRAWRAEKQAEEKELKLKEKQRKLDRAARSM